MPKKIVHDKTMYTSIVDLEALQSPNIHIAPQRNTKLIWRWSAEASTHRYRRPLLRKSNSWFTPGHASNLQHCDISFCPKTNLLL